MKNKKWTTKRHATVESRNQSNKVLEELYGIENEGDGPDNLVKLMTTSL